MQGKIMNNVCRQMIRNLREFSEHFGEVRKCCEINDGLHVKIQNNGWRLISINADIHHIPNDVGLAMTIY